MKTAILTLALGAMTLGAMAQVDNPDSPEFFYPNLDKNFTVKGQPNIKGFILATNLDNGEGWDEEEATIDLANGYFKFSMEGAGGVSYEAAYWNRTDGKKLFIVSYDIRDEVFSVSQFTPHSNKWAKMQYCKSAGFYEDSGYMAYVYDASTKKLVRMTESPFNNMPATSDMVIYRLPQKGKDIKILQYDLDKDFNRENAATHTLKFNGMTFDYIK